MNSACAALTAKQARAGSARGAGVRIPPPRQVTVTSGSLLMASTPVNGAELFAALTIKTNYARGKSMSDHAKPAPPEAFEAAFERVFRETHGTNLSETQKALQYGAARWGHAWTLANDPVVRELVEACYKFTEYFVAINAGEYNENLRPAPLRDYELTILTKGCDALAAYEKGVKGGTDE